MPEDAGPILLILLPAALLALALVALALWRGSIASLGTPGLIVPY
jgi:hypothetical protein